MPRTAQDFPGIDLGEQKNVSYNFGVPGHPDSPLAAGETIASVSFQMSVVSGIDTNPQGCMIGSGVVQPGGLVVTQPVAPQVAGVVYEIKAIAVTSTIPPQILTPFSHLPCNPAVS
jgi:hypothetical protein